MNATTSLKIAATALAMISGTAVLAESQGAKNPAAEAQAFLPSPTTLAQATAAAEAAAGGKVSSIEYQTGENGAPDLIMAFVTLADGSQKVAAINPADGKVMNVTMAANDATNTENAIDSKNAGDSEN